MNNRIRTGIGFDAHPLKAGRKLILGGIEIPYTKGLDGWSDADALTHAIIDAMLGAAALGDIGVHFPSGDKSYKDMSSLIMLARAKGMLSAKGWQISNIDATIVAEKPRLREHIDAMRNKLAGALGISSEFISVKASTANGMGAVGRGEGIMVYAVAQIEKANFKS
jgi:2-C-methyl-D-erythritol 2,4-cyclodiphosphate synthase